MKNKELSIPSTSTFSGVCAHVKIRGDDEVDDDKRVRSIFEDLILVIDELMILIASSIESSERMKNYRMHQFET